MECCVLKLFDVLGGFWASLNWFSQDSHIDDQILIIVNLKLRIGEWMKRYYALQQSIWIEGKGRPIKVQVKVMYNWMLWSENVTEGYKIQWCGNYLFLKKKT